MCGAGAEHMRCGVGCTCASGESAVFMYLCAGVCGSVRVPWCVGLYMCLATRGSTRHTDTMSHQTAELFNTCPHYMCRPYRSSSLLWLLAGSTPPPSPKKNVHSMIEVSPLARSLTPLPVSLPVSLCVATVSSGCVQDGDDMQAPRGMQGPPPGHRDMQISLRGVS